jgi:NAD(P)-dependent dehydrogenase (short-subunit alcohol dehydrogenase family)
MLHENLRLSLKPQRSSTSGSRPINRFGTAKEIAEAIAWLLSPASSYATGAAFAIDGGYTCV